MFYLSLSLSGLHISALCLPTLYSVMSSLLSAEKRNLSPKSPGGLDRELAYSWHSLSQGFQSLHPASICLSLPLSTLSPSSLSQIVSYPSLSPFLSASVSLSLSLSPSIPVKGNIPAKAEATEALCWKGHFNKREHCWEFPAALQPAEMQTAIKPSGQNGPEIDAWWSFRAEVGRKMMEVFCFAVVSNNHVLLHSSSSSSSSANTHCYL